MVIGAHSTRGGGRGGGSTSIARKRGFAYRGGMRPSYVKSVSSGE